MPRSINTLVSVRFYVKDYWVYQEAKRRARIKGISIQAELIENSRNHYMIENAALLKEKVTISKYMYNIMELLSKEFRNFVNDTENKKEGNETDVIGRD